MLIKKCLFRAMSSSITFTWPHGGTKVELAGSFNGWKPVEMNPSEDRKLWQLPVELQRGRHEFKFVVDGRWCHDPDQTNNINDVGSLNNIVDVKGGQRKLHSSLVRFPLSKNFSDDVNPTIWDIV